MDDSIVDIDEALSDSFSAPTDESFDDVNAIVQKWKQTGEESSPIGDDKFLNTRTFTRPKRRVYAKCSPNMFATPQPVSNSSTTTPSASINLKIGGLVTGGGGSSNSMQRSFLGDVSPPSSMCSTSFTSATLDQQMIGSLITSNDFTGINYFADSNVPAMAAADRFNELFETSRPQVFDDISMLNAQFDADDGGDVPEADDTFVQLTVRVGGFEGGNSVETKNRPIVGDLNNTILLDDGSIVASEDIQLNATYDNDTLTNRTLVVMDAQQPLNVTVDAVPSVTAAQQPFEDKMANESCVMEPPNVDNAGNEIAWGRTLNDTFQLDEIQLEADNTFDMGAGLQPAMDESIPYAGHLVQPERDYGLQSTPLKARTTQNNMLNDFTSIVNISPITNQTNQPSTNVSNAPNSNFQTYVRPKSRSIPPVPTATAAEVVPSTDDDIDDLPSPIIRTASANRSERPTNVQRDLDERQSLTNFEEFEKSMSLCQNDHDFDDMLNGLAGRSQQNRNATTDVQMRQSLDHIKKRHSLLNLEKQLEDQQRRITTTVVPTPPSNATADSNRLLNSTQSNRSMTSSSMLLSTSSGSGERLLRRSRVMDEYSSPSRGTTLTMDKSSGSVTSGSSSTASVLSDSKENVQNNFDSNRGGVRDTEQSNSTTSTGGGDSGGVMELKPRSIPNNRDRFKTIRISKRPPEHDAIPHIPDDACTYGEVPDDGDSNGPPSASESSVQQFAMNDTNREPSPPQATLPRRRLTRPSQLSGLTMRRESSLTIGGRVNGGTLAMQQQQQPQNADAPRSQVKSITSPMGIKAKSIQNLVEREKSSDETNARSQKEQSDPVFKVPSGLPTTQRMRSIARPSGLIRPSSGLYSYGVRRNDSDTESGRMSPTNSLSSGSSKGSLYRADADTTSSADDVVKAEVMEPMAPTAPVKVVQPPPRRSGLQPPSASGAYAAANRKRSGLPRPMSMANR